MVTGLEQWREEFPGYYSGLVIVAQNDSAVIAVEQVECFSRSCILHITTAAHRRPEPDAPWPSKGTRFPLFHSPPEAEIDDPRPVRFGIRLADDSTLPLTPESVQLFSDPKPTTNYHLTFHHATGTSTDTAKIDRAQIELNPLPPEPWLELTAAWPLFGLKPSRASIPVAPIYEAARSARNHWR